MNTNISKLFCLVLLTTLIVLATACATPEQPAGIAQTTTTAIPATAPKPIIQVIPYEGAVKDRVIFTEEISQNNCGNSRDLPHSVDRSQTVAYTLEVGGGVTVNVDGTISAGLPGDLADIEVSVGAEVAAQYGVSYGKEETFSKSLTVVTEAGSNRQFTIRHIELWETGELVITIGEWQQRYPYKFRRGFGLEQVDSRDLGCPTPTVEPTGAPPPEPTLTPTRRPPTTTSTPTLPPKESGWHLYDDFTAPDALDTNWWLNDENQICTLDISEGQLSFDCSNETAGDLGAALHPSHPSDTLTGIAVTVSVERIGGPFQLVTSWQCDADGSRRDYHLELDMDAVRATEFYPQENWRIVPLGEVAVTPNEAHVLQMERTSDSIEFFVDGQPLLLDTAPELPACFSANYWSFDFWVWKDDNRLKGQIDQVSVQSTDAPVSPSPTKTCDAAALFQRGWDLIDQGTQNCDEAWKKMNEAVLCNPDDAQMWYGRGNVNFQCGAYKEAVNDFTEAILMNDKNPLYYEMRALTYMRLGDADSYESCVQDFIRVLKLAPNNVTALDDKPECQRAISPFFDDFETGTIDPSMWDMGEAQYISVKDGHLYFDAPLNDSTDWVGYQLKAELPGSSISRIMFTVKLDTPPGTDLGWLILGTSCGKSPGWMGAYAGGPEGRFVAVYAPGGSESDEIYYESVTDGQSHTVDLQWVGDGVKVYIDGQLQHEKIPCEGPAYYANFGAGLNRGTRVSGYMDDISIWP